MAANANADAHELLEKLVIKWLPEAGVDFLTARLVEFAVEIPPEKANNQMYLVRLISRYLYSEALEESDDGGVAVWLKLFGELGTALGKGEPKSEEPAVPNPVVVAPVLGNNVAPLPQQDHLQAGAMALDPDNNGAAGMTFHKIREFKINGTVNAGKEGTLQYVSLFSQIQLGLAAKYTTAEIIYGVVRAIPAASSFRTMLETNLNMPMSEFIKLLRSHYKEQDSDSALLELKSCYQLAEQGAHDFCCRAIFLRDRLKVIAAEEGSPWEPEKLRRRLFRTINTGLKQNGVKIELQPYLSEESTLSDREFLEKVTLAEVHEEERLGKVKTKEADIAAMLTSKKSGQNSASGHKFSSSSAAVCAATAAQPPEIAPEIREYINSVVLLTTKIDQLSTQSAAQFSRLKALENMLSDQKAPGLTTGSQIVTTGPNAGQQCGITNPVGKSGSGNGRRIFKCKDCVDKNVGYCHHCFKCNGIDHKAKDCPKN